jgi:hypothetical protein
MALRLSKDSINAEDVIKNLVEENQRNVQFFLVEYFEAGFEVGAQFFSVDRNIVLRQPVGEEYQSSQCFFPINVEDTLGGIVNYLT